MRDKYSCVIFDFGGVISFSQRPGFVGEMGALLGVRTEPLAAAYRRWRAEYDRGTLSGEQYFRRVLAEAGAVDGASRIPELIRLDAESWTSVNGDVLEAVRTLRGRGYRTAVISNMPWDIGLRIRRQWSWLDELFDLVVFSCEVGMVKPEPGIYRRALEDLKLPARECLFVDDSEANVAAAADLGMTAVLFRGLEDLWSALEG